MFKNNNNNNNHNNKKHVKKQCKWCKQGTCTKHKKPHSAKPKAGNKQCKWCKQGTCTKHKKPQFAKPKAGNKQCKWCANGTCNKHNKPQFAKPKTGNKQCKWCKNGTCTKHNKQQAAGNKQAKQCKWCANGTCNKHGGNKPQVGMKPNKVSTKDYRNNCVCGCTTVGHNCFFDQNNQYQNNDFGTIGIGGYGASNLTWNQQQQQMFGTFYTIFFSVFIV